MANIRLIKRRIKSAGNIAQITKAMQMVAASKMKKAQDMALAGKPYSEKIYSAVKELASHTKRENHPLLRLGNPAGKILVILISTNKGLCGGLNTNLFRMIDAFLEKRDADFITIGKKGENFVVRTDKTLLADFSFKLPFIEHVPPVAKLLIEGFLGAKYKEVYLVYNSFFSVLKQIPAKKMILPISELEEVTSEEEAKFSEFVVEPSEEEMLDFLLPHFLENQIRSAIFEAEASEHSARMIAMKNATDAALDFADSLTLLFNKVRQEKITYEISDMVTARLAVEI